MSMKRNIFLLFFIILIVSSCSTFDHKNPYPNMEIIDYESNHAYLFKAHRSEKLIICLEGSGWDSNLGIKGKKRWKSTRVGGQLLQTLGDEYTILIPEKLNRLPGNVHYNDMHDRAAYTIDNIVDGYVGSINGYISENEPQMIFLVGISEGAAILPEVYNRIIDKNRIRGMVSYGFGGLSLIESYEIILKYDFLPDDAKYTYSHIISTFSQESTDLPLSYKEDYFSVTYRYLNSFLFIRPVEAYKNMDIPILFLHGKKDINTAVESTQYIQRNLPQDKFEYIYYDWAHAPGNYFEIIKFRNDISNWIRALSK